MAESTLLSLSVGEFLDRLASSAPTPGGGAAAALCGAMAAGLGQMVCELTIGKPKFAAVEAEVRELRERFERARRMLEQLTDEDAAAYGQLAAAFKLDKLDSNRSQTIAATADVAACAPLETATVANQVRRDGLRLRQIGNPNLAADSAALLALAEAAIRAASVNVEANLPLVTEARRAALSAGLSAVVRRVAEGRDVEH